MDVNVTIEFLKEHLNFAALGGLVFMLSMFFMSKKNYRYGLIVLIICVVYFGYMHNMANNDPDFVERISEQTKKADVETIFWGADKGANYRKKAEQNSKEAGEYGSDKEEGSSYDDD